MYQLCAKAFSTISQVPYAHRIRNETTWKNEEKKMAELEKASVNSQKSQAKFQTSFSLHHLHA